MVVTGFDGKEYEVEPNANLSRTNLAVEGSSLSWQDLRGRDFSHQDLREANLCCAVCNDETVFPRGFARSDCERRRY